MAHQFVVHEVFGVAVETNGSDLEHVQLLGHAESEAGVLFH